MACSGGGVPAERAAAAVSYLIDVREGLMRLKRVLLPEEKSTAAAAAAPWAEQLMDGMMNKLSSAILALGGAVVGDTDAAGRQSLVAGPEPADGVVIRQTGESPAVRTRKRSSRRSRQPSDKRVAAKPDDGHVWRKYGQKNIQNSPYPRSYYRCTHRSDQGCRATKQVQLSETDPSMHVITYYGQHTCRDPSAVIPPTAADIPTAGASNMMISFVSPVSYSHAAAAGGAALVMEAGTSTTRLSPSWCTSGGGDDVFSSSSEPPPAFVQWDELAAAVAGSAGVTSSSMVGSAAPAESGGVGDTAGGGGYGGGGGSSPSSPSAGSLGFVVGSLGSIGDDGFFPFDQ